MENLYEKLKKWSAEHKKEIWVGACFVLVFWIGFGTGRYDRQVIAAQRKLPNNYSKNPEPNQKTVGNGGEGGAEGGQVKGVEADNLQAEAAKPAAPKAAEGQPKIGSECVVKGNISGNNKIYHVKGGSFYERTNPEMCFATEAEAKEAGFRKAAR